MSEAVLKAQLVAQLQASGQVSRADAGMVADLSFHAVDRAIETLAAVIDSVPSNLGYLVAQIAPQLLGARIQASMPKALAEIEALDDTVSARIKLDSRS